jgi:FkbM family methyltransferase
MPFLNIRHSHAMRWPLLALARMVLKPLRCGLPILRRAAYDSIPVPYLVTGTQELFVIDTQDRVIGRQLFLHGEFDFHKLQTALLLLKREGCPPPDHLIDVGANIGSIVIPALKRGLMQTASAIEPHPGNLRLLRANLALNEILDSVSIFDVAAGAQSHSTLLLQESSTNSGNHSIGRSGISVRSMRLDDLEIPFESALLWMDIEGYEGHALEGASRILAAGTPFVSEFNPRFLAESSGMDAFEAALLHRRIFDLGDPGRETSFASLISRYRGNYTDILAI